MPKGEPTRVVRLPAWFLDMQTPHAERAGCTVAELIVKRMTPSVPMTELEQRVAGIKPSPRCDCKTPTMSKVVSNICTTCHRLR